MKTASGVDTNMRKSEVGGIKDVSREAFFAPTAQDSLYDKNEAGLEYVNKGGVGSKDNLGGENTRT